MTADQATIASFAVAAVAAVTAAGRWGLPRLGRFFRSVDRMFETINGRPAELDKAGREVQPASPSLSVQLADLKDAVSDQAAQNVRISSLEVTTSAHAKILAEHAERFGRLDSGAQAERIVGRVESVQAWKTMEAIASQPPTEDDQ